MLGYKDTTSKLAVMSPASSLMVLMIRVNCSEFLMYDLAFSTDGCMMLARYFSSFCRGELRALTIGLMGTSGLWIFGNPYSFGHLLDFSRGISFCLISGSMADSLILV